AVGLFAEGAAAALCACAITVWSFTASIATGPRRNVVGALYLAAVDSIGAGAGNTGSERAAPGSAAPLSRRSTAPTAAPATNASTKACRDPRRAPRRATAVRRAGVGDTGSGGVSRASRGRWLSVPLMLGPPRRVESAGNRCRYYTYQSACGTPKTTDFRN